MIKLKRAEENPVLLPNADINWESKAVFNPGVILKDNEVYLLYRAIGEYEAYISRLGLAVSQDGFNFERKSELPLIKPTTSYDKWACEDPRITKISDIYYITYVAIDQRIKHEEGGKFISIVSQTALVTTKDFVKFQKHGIITPKDSDNRDVVIFPEKIDGKFVILHRPHRWCKHWFEKPESKEIDVAIPIPYEELPQKPSTWISYSSNLNDWCDHKLLMSPSHENDKKIGPGAPPIKTDEGWLLIYHHVEKGEKGRIYTAKAALLDLNDPAKIIAKIPYPILTPEEEYEIKGDVDNVIFPTGALVKNNELFVYYGAADKYCGLATIKLDIIMDELLRYRNN